MKYKIILALLIVLFVLGLTYFIRLNQKGYNSEISDNTNSSKNNLGGITLQVLAKHNTEQNCWVAYDGKVYDITSWLPKHPGSAKAISPYCGTADEFKNAFEKKHGTTKVNMLMKVGVLMGDFDIMGAYNAKSIVTSNEDDVMEDYNDD